MSTPCSSRNSSGLISARDVAQATYPSGRTSTAVWYLTDRPSGGDAEPVVFVDQRSRHLATVGEVNKQRPSVAGELGHAPCSSGGGHCEVGNPVSVQRMRIADQNHPADLVLRRDP